MVNIDMMVVMVIVVNDMFKLRKSKKKKVDSNNFPTEGREKTNKKYIFLIQVKKKKK